ncbi:MAG: SDR family NAD(P)-dependent oxidoreductase [Beutenbergiaceae bacterium]
MSTAAIEERPWAVVTGGAGDIGRAIARHLAKHSGYRVLVCDVLAQDEGDALTQALAADARVDPGTFGYRRADVRVQHELVDALSDLAPLDLVVANAGIVDSAPFLEISEESWRAQLDINLCGAFNTAQAAARSMVQQNGGQIVFISSWVAQRPWPEITAYATTKAGIEALARQLAMELAPHGVRANVVAPGIVAAGMAKQQMLTEPQYAERASRAIPLGRFQQPDDVAAVVGFLASSGGDYFTGATLLADGGSSVGS